MKTKRSHPQFRQFRGSEFSWPRLFDSVDTVLPGALRFAESGNCSDNMVVAKSNFRKAPGGALGQRALPNPRRRKAGYGLATGGVQLLCPCGVPTSREGQCIHPLQGQDHVAAAVRGNKADGCIGVQRKSCHAVTKAFFRYGVAKGEELASAPAVMIWRTGVEPTIRRQNSLNRGRLS